MKHYGWTIQEVDAAPYHRLLELIIEKKKKEKVMSAADFIGSLR